VAILVISFFIFARGNDEAVVTDAHLETQES
jgi:hypothetical protein